MTEKTYKHRINIRINGKNYPTTYTASDKTDLKYLTKYMSEFESIYEAKILKGDKIISLDEIEAELRQNEHQAIESEEPTIFDTDYKHER